MPNQNSPIPDQGISFHPYVFKIRDPKHRKAPSHKPRDSEDAVQVTEEIQRIIANVHTLDPNTPIWVTELGFPVKSGEARIPEVSLGEQEILVRKSFWMLLKKRKRLNIKHALYYNIQDLSAGPEWSHHTGLLDANRNPRKAWGAFIETVEAE